MIEALDARTTRIMRNALLATTALPITFVLASSLWSAGHPQWSFAITFCAVWGIITFSWSLNHINQESGMLLETVVERNFEQIYQHLAVLEEKFSLLEKAAVENGDKETPAEGGK